MFDLIKDFFRQFGDVFLICGIALLCVVGLVSIFIYCLCYLHF